MCARSYMCVVGALLLAVAADTTLGATIVHRTCRVPVLDSHRSYHISAAGARSNMDEVYACLEYNDLPTTAHGTSSLVAMKCVITKDRQPMLVMDAAGVAVCRAQIPERNGEARGACNLPRPDRTGSRYLRLTGQSGGVAERRLDRLFVTHLSVVCTESYGDARHAVPAAEALVCRAGDFSAHVPGAMMETAGNHSCSTIFIRTPGH